MTPPSTQLAVSDNGRYVTVPLNSGPSRFHAVWLQDNALDPASISATNGQKLLTLHAQPADPVIVSACLDRGRQNLAGHEKPQDTVVIHMANATSSLYEYPLAWLEEHQYDRQQHCEPGWIDPCCQLWGSDLQADFPSADYRQISQCRKALMQWLRLVRRLGFGHLDQVGTQPGELLKAASLFGYTRETNYGHLFDVKTEVNAGNLAYTSLGLQAHTDNPYRHPVPSMQILSCLQNSSSGGESIVVDGFHAARVLQQENAGHFELLSRHCVRFQYSGAADVRLSAKKPILEVAADGELVAIRFNSRSIAPISDVPFQQMPSFYAAYRHFNDIIERPALRLEFRLQPGELFIVNNTRVLHARTGYSSTGNRHLQGCYPDIDGMLSTLAVLEEQFGS